MKKIFTIILTAMISINFCIFASAEENLKKEYIEEKIWEEMWHGKNDDGYKFPEASYKHHLLVQWVEDNYGNDDYNWGALGELKYAYKDYYRDLIKEWTFFDDGKGNWSIIAPDNRYTFSMLNGRWNMIDKNGSTVDTFPPFNSIEEEKKAKKNNSKNEETRKSDDNQETNSSGNNAETVTESNNSDEENSGEKTTENSSENTTENGQKAGGNVQENGENNSPRVLPHAETKASESETDSSEVMEETEESESKPNILLILAVVLLAVCVGFVGYYCFGKDKKTKKK